ncbi:MAG: right-handed parallel beta-helix repeat-containing protein, partial [Myxococcales bacterium]|nr:right-handed parallel beta-helix repeat-containing protein [Myxococcales bacterium]
FTGYGPEGGANAGLYVYSGCNMTFTNNVFVGRDATFGTYCYGAYWIKTGSVLENNTFICDADTTYAAGFGLYAASAQSMVFRNNSFSVTNVGIGVGLNSYGFRLIEGLNVQLVNNTFTGAESGVSIEGGSGFIIDGNYIESRGGGTDGSGANYAIWTSLASGTGTVQNNVIRSSNSGVIIPDNFGISTIRNNTFIIDGGRGIWHNGTSFSGGRITNNIFYGTTTGTTAVYAAQYDFFNNLAYNSFYGVDKFVQDSGGICTQASCSGTASVEAEPVFVDAANDDFHLTIASDCNILEGGSNGSYNSKDDFADPDRDGVTRTAEISCGPTNNGDGFSLGAYELDE